ncbi:sphingolipid delta(4)-desaturase DES1-like [Lytechinus variegatus]|uniref:sphingolipid delta(4)-desaturase DES1-like n=1 Tax=Lytechinus variegatus TaxID=7654 RepID=UPI001BB18D69|nr:sphingolipid delta(4)-desaturase DES1-like [Lytechinus variegatus]
MGGSVSRSDFAWVYTDEPHFTRRKEMLKKYPEIKRLMGYDTNIANIMLAMVLVQVITSYLLRNESWMTIVIVGYCFGGVVNHSMTLALHEVGHNLAYGHARPMWNRIIGFIGNLVIGVPVSISFKRYHQDHHKYQGEDTLDPDIPSEWEGILFRKPFTKAIWMLLQPAFYAFRPFIKRPKVPSKLEVINLIVQLVFNAAIIYFFSLKAYIYLILGSILTMGLHPLAGHFISEHYLYEEGHETYSYYGPFNYIAFNVGYHMEHHDFPNIPGYKLPLIRKIAPEYYDPLPTHESFAKVVWDFVMSPKIGPYARVKRPNSIDPRSIDPWDMPH